MTGPKREPLHTFFDDPTTDVLISTILSLTTELSVTRERLDTLERVLADKGTIGRTDIEAFQADPDAAKERAANRQTLLTSVIGKMNAFFESASRAKSV
ncbi:MAG: hypothetical protein AAF225_14320 [Pseudomonadota bacterium]